MYIRQKIIISLILHITLIVVSFSINFSEKAYPLPEEHVIVSIVEEFSGDRLFTVENNTENRHLNQEILQLRLRIAEKNKDEIAEPALIRRDCFNQYDCAMTDEGSLKNPQTENTASEYNKENNPPLPPFTKRGAGGDFKGGLGGFPEQNTSSQIINKGQLEGEILVKVEKSFLEGNTGSFYALIRAAIEKAKTYPLIARKRGVEGTVLVSFRIDVKGLPQNVMIVKSSGYQILDDEVQKMLRKASPFPELNGEIVIPITFKLSGSISNR
ncbi:MAG: energy transducer TonB [Nitrospirota bacterium]